MQDDAPSYLTTREVADMLRVKERKVYDLAAAGEIPHRRITGKLLFPRDEIMAWIDGPDPARDRPAVLAGSHDPLLDWAVRESGCGLATLFDGSRDGLERFAGGDAALCGLHLPEPDGWNVQTVAARGLRDCVLIGWAERSRGLLLAPALRGEIGGIGDLRGRRMVMRQPGAGAAALCERLLDGAGLTQDDLAPCGGLARTESDAAAAVAAGEADAALGIEAMARRFHLEFLPLTRECFDLLIDRRAYFTDPVQRLLAFCATDALREKADAMGGYDLAPSGAVRWLTP
ncbi:excisionase [Maritimibacter sp. 55A14]|nr:excisionase [Maritimibacter sp. 55A14]